MRLKRPVAPLDLAQFYQHLANLIRVGTPLTECFDVLKQDVESRRLAAVIDELKNSAQVGLSLSECFAKSALITNQAVKRLLSSAHNSGDLHTTLMAMADEQKHLAMIGRIKRKMLFWPTVYLLFAGCFSLVLSIFVFPAFQSFFEGFDVILPLPTRIMSNLGGGYFGFGFS